MPLPGQVTPLLRVQPLLQVVQLVQVRLVLQAPWVLQVLRVPWGFLVQPVQSRCCRCWGHYSEVSSRLLGQRRPSLSRPPRSSTLQPAVADLPR